MPPPDTATFDPTVLPPAESDSCDADATNTVGTKPLGSSSTATPSSQPLPSLGSTRSGRAREGFRAGAAHTPDRRPPRPGEPAYVGFGACEEGYLRWRPGVVVSVHCDIATRSGRYVVRLADCTVAWPIERLRW